MESSDFEDTEALGEIPRPQAMYPPQDEPTRVFDEDNPWGNQFPIDDQIERFTKIRGRKFVGNRGSPKTKWTIGWFEAPSASITWRSWQIIPQSPGRKMPFLSSLQTSSLRG